MPSRPTPARAPQLRGQVDQSLKSLTAQISQRDHQPPPGFFGGGAGSPPSDGPGETNQGVASTPGADGCPSDSSRGGIDLSGGPGFGGAAGLRQFVSPTGQACKSGDGTELPINARVKAIAAATRGEYLTDMTVAGHHLRVLTTGVPQRGAIMVALPLADVDHALSHQLLLLVLIAAGGIALAALFGILVARTALAPIARFTRRTESIAASTDWLEHERLEVAGSDELARLARTFNTTLDALERSVAAQRSLVADASHELRTPIASIRANLQLLRDEDLLSPRGPRGPAPRHDPGARRADSARQRRGRARARDQGRCRARRRARRCDRRRRCPAHAPARAWAPIDAAVEPTLVRGEGERIARAVTNLLDNAAKWSPSGGLIEVELRDGTLTVRDHGPGFHEDDLPYVFDRFHRAKDARSKPGSGLGLAIVRQAAEAHGGFVEAGNAAGGGALLRIGFGPPLELEDQPAQSVSAS